jgi:hypothetical protein
MIAPFEFNEKVAIETILYLATKSTNPALDRITKLLYFADRFHLAKYGRFICGDRYIAMKHGPVPSGVYDILKSVRDCPSYLEIPEAKDAFKIQAADAKMKKCQVVPLRPPDMEWLSDSDVECLDEALQKYDHLDFTKLASLSQDDAWRSADEDESISLDAIVESIGNPEGLLEYLSDPYP